MLRSRTVRRLLYDTDAGGLSIAIHGPVHRRYFLDSWQSGLSLHGDDPGEPLDLVLVPVERERDEESSRALAAFSAAIPAEMVHLVTPFPHAQLQILQLLRWGGEAAMELARGMPVLVWLLASAMLAGEVAPDRALALMHGKRLAIVRAVCREGSAAHLKFIRRVRARQYTVRELRVLHWAAGEATILRHLQHCSPVVLPLLAECVETPELLAVPLLQREISRENGSVYRIKTALAMCRTCFRLGAEGGVSNVEHILRNCKTLEELIALSNAWHGKYNRRLNEEQASLRREREAVAEFDLIIRAEMRRRVRVKREQRAARAAERKENRQVAVRYGFPKPPVLGNEYIVPITTYEKLVLEGKTMSNCVATYLDKVANGKSYIYKVYYPERCTLEILCSQRGRRCAIGEFKAARNMAPSKQARQYVEAWLQRAMELQKS